eukprot:g3302.t1
MDPVKHDFDLFCDESFFDSINLFNSEAYPRWFSSSSVHQSNDLDFLYSNQQIPIDLMYESMGPAELPVSSAGNLIDGFRLDSQMTFPESQSIHSVSKEDEFSKSLTNTVVQQQRPNDVVVASEFYTPVVTHNAIRRSSIMHELSRSRDTKGAKTEKEVKWYAPLLPSILKSQEVTVRRASHNSRDGSERITVHMRSLEDGYKWRKYGQKSVKGNTHPRSYYKCTYPCCPCRKRVEKCPKEAGVLLSTYEGLHCHPPVTNKYPLRPRVHKKPRI